MASPLSDSPTPGMRAAVIDEVGRIDAIHTTHLPVPRCGPGEVLIRVRAAAIDHVDVLVVTGAYPTRTPFPFVIGRDAVGEVVTVDGEAVPFTPGEMVWTNSLGYDGRAGVFAE
ncbi:alcohol dehydrogenase catalytic domain-containing protein [Brachybacterium sp. EF45031]|uniref:alcohol dehydrogenase catalytic domain-containing protein n=1 Tax=Brachybacterium sillae TaxID=2810536 RepID=UPI00217F106C|nr:alcohol dehydrogenase catalytic domain-containing protein [Brachybacterium sillae]MCS6712498.1 alcohol dehydrogenase catalytic domain-containing protein [Brachybacterium sillae]